MCDLLAIRLFHARIFCMQKLTKKELKEQKKLEKQQWEQDIIKRQRMRQYTIWGALAAVLIVSAAAIFYLMNRPTSQQAVMSDVINSSLPQVTETDYVSGPDSSTVTIIEYGDFQCPACGHYYSIVKQLKNEYKDTVRFVYRNFPLQIVHKNAQLAAQASYASAKQDKFWEMHDILFEKQAEWGESDDAENYILTYATQIGLDLPTFKVDASSSEAASFVNAQSDGGKKAGVQGTPTFFMNGKQLTNPATYDEFKKLVDTELTVSK